MNKVDRYYTKSDYVLGTFITIRACGIKAINAIDESIKKLREIDDLMSSFKDYSDISKINKNAGLKFTKIDRQTLLVIKKAITYSKLSRGGFDITVKPIINLWKKSEKSKSIPSKDEIDKMIELVNYKDIKIFFNFVKLKNKGQSIDLGGIAKGYAADEVFKILKSNGIESGIIDLGGNVVTLGKKLDGEKWTVGIQDPFNERGVSFGVLRETNKSIVTSGDYERFIEIDGNKYHHFIDKNTGYPLDNGIKSITIVSDKSIVGDGLSSVLFSIGIDKGLEIVNSIKGVTAIFVDKYKNIYLSKGLKKKFKLLDNSYNVIGEK